jgi:hypothetical protein
VNEILFAAPDPARAGGASVTFEPGARPAWHTHSLGQTLIITAGWADGGANERKPIMSNVWFITGRAMGVPTAKAALADGNAVIATGITKETHQ